MIKVMFFMVELREDEDDDIHLEKSYEAGDEEDCGDDVAW